MLAAPSPSNTNTDLQVRPLWPWLALLALALGVYLLGLGGQYNPSNGDELVYTHIARLTAASGQWLPLVSELDHMRNTKPPLLFWQAMVAGGWGDHWNMAALRTPSVLYTLLTVGAIGLILRRICGDVRSAILGACIYLAFFCTFRFGRSYLTSAPETFWLALPMFWLLWRSSAPSAADKGNSQCLVKPGMTGQGGPVATGWLAHIGFGLALGVGLAYKSFALVAPAAAVLWCVQVALVSQPGWRGVAQISFKVALSSSLALAIFGLWFVLDPDPAAVWQEFVLAENAGKMSNSAGYWYTALFGGGFSLWAQALGYVQNAGLLSFVVLGLMVYGAGAALQRWRHRATCAALPVYQTLLLLWLVVWLLVFMLPSQRSARYLIPAMPALAMLLGLYWQRIARAWFVPSLLLCGVFTAALARIAWSAQALGIGSMADLLLTALAAALVLLLVVWGVLSPAWTRMCTLGATLGVFAVFGLTTNALNGASGQYDTALLAKMQQQRIAVPSSFNGQFERFEFLLPGNRFVPYDGDALANLSAADNARQLQQLLATHDAVVWLQTHAETSQPMCAPKCTVLGQRWEVKGRHQSGEIILSNVWTPQQWLFRREWLLAHAAQ